MCPVRPVTYVSGRSLHLSERTSCASCPVTWTSKPPRGGPGWAVTVSIGARRASPRHEGLAASPSFPTALLALLLTAARGGVAGHSESSGPVFV
jgi:hypothetical protein